MGSFKPSNTILSELTNSGTTTSTRPDATNLGANGSIPITATVANVDANGSARTGIRFAGTGTAGQIIFVFNTGGESLRFHGTEGTALLKGVADEFDLMENDGCYMFVSDGGLWNFVGGGADAGGGLGDSS